MEPETTEDQVPAELGDAGVLVYALDTPEGMRIGFKLIGGLPLVSVPVVLELAVKAARNQLGLE